MLPARRRKACALPIRLRSTCTSRPSTARTFSGRRRRHHHHRVAARSRVASSISARVRQDRHDVHRLGRRDPREFRVQPGRVADVADQPVQPHHILGDDGQQPALLAGSSMRRSVSMALRIEASGFLISCATSAAKRSVASIRVPQRRRLSVSARPVRRPHRLRRPAASPAPRPTRPLPSRMSARPRPGAGSGRAMVSDRYQDSATVSASASANRPRIDADRQQAVVHLARLARQQHDADRVPVALHRLGDRHQQPVVAACGGYRAAFRCRHWRRSGAAPPSRRAASRRRRRGRHLDATAPRSGAAAMPAAGRRCEPIVPSTWPRSAAGGSGSVTTAPPGALAHPAVGDQLPVGRVEPRLRIGRWFGQPAQQRPGEVRHQLRVVGMPRADRALAQRAGKDARLLAQRRTSASSSPFWYWSR